MKLINKVAIITGATGGIGAATARLLSEKGVKLVLTGRSEEKLKKLADELDNAIFMAGDITDPHLPEKLMNLALDTYEQLDILFNNAGLMEVSSIEEANIEKMCLMVRVNFEALVRMGYTAMKHFVTQNSGFLLNTSSIAGTKTAATMGAYSGTKFAVEAFTDGIRQDVSQKNANGATIGVSCIAPGTVNTGLFDSWDEKKRDYVHSGGALDPEDIARTVLFILEQPEQVTISHISVFPLASPI